MQCRRPLPHWAQPALALVSAPADARARAEQAGRRVGYYNSDDGQDPFALATLAEAPEPA